MTVDAKSLEPGGFAELFSPVRRADPYPGYARLREVAPIWEAAAGFLVLSRYADCARVLRDARFGHLDGEDVARRRSKSNAPHEASEGDREPARTFLVLNPPDHTRLRRLVSRSFTPRRIGELAPRIEEITGDLLRAVAGRRSFDVVAALAAPLPVAVISELLGVPVSDRPQLITWSHALARGIEPAFLVPEEERRAQMVARGELAEYLMGQIARRRRAPTEDLVSSLVAVHDRGESLTEAEIVATCILLLIAGHETTTSLIGNGLCALARNPDQLDELASHPELAPGAVEELLRYDSPVQLTTRVALDDAEAAGVVVKKGTFVVLLVGAANRDPRVYRDPDRLDLRRAPSSHLAFGQGIHFCLGAPLARLEAQIAIRAFVRAFGTITLVGTPTWKDNAVLRGVRRLEVEVRP